MPTSTQIAILGGNNSATTSMHSLEISELTGSRHDSVKRTIETMAAKGVIEFPQSVEIPTATKPASAYLFSNEKGRRDSIIVVAQLCPEFTARIVDRWQELEVEKATPSFAIPATFSQALLLAAHQAEQIEKQQAALALAAPKVAFVDSYVDATGLKGFREAAKLLKINEARFRDFLTAQKIMYRLGGEWVAYQQHIDAGRFAIKAGKSPQNNHAYSRCLFTPKGLQWVACEWAKWGLHTGVVAQIKA